MHDDQYAALPWGGLFHRLRAYEGDVDRSDPAEVRLELLRHRCSVIVDHGHDWWPYDTFHLERL
ncbi:hypothetical protein [Nonomuraea africana]|nr:hypothetical protein [Nonomuraea africana]